MGRPRRGGNEEPCCDGSSLKIPCIGCIPPFRLHYVLVLILVFIGVFWYLSGTDSKVIRKLYEKGNQVAAAGGGNSPWKNSLLINLLITVFLIMIGTTILHESGHAAATMCAPGGTVRHIMLNPCCGGHAYVGHQGGELWEAWIAFAGPMWDITIFFIIYFIQVSREDDNMARSWFLQDYLNGWFGLDTVDLDMQSLGNQALELHFWRIALAIIMDLEFVTFCFNMLPIITLDGADFFGSFVRLCSTPLIAAIFIITTSVICLAGLAWLQLISPGLDLYNDWGKIPDPKFQQKRVLVFFLVAYFIIAKLWGLIRPTIQLCSRACGDKLYKYHVFQDHEGKRRAALRESGGYRQRAIVVQPQYPPHGGAGAYGQHGGYHRQMAQV